jgi:flagellar FliL protein
MNFCAGCKKRIRKMPLEEEQKEAREKPKSNKLLIIAPLLIVLLGAGGAVAYFKFIKASPEKTEEKKEVQPVICEMDTFMVNMADPGGKRFLKATMKLKVSSPEVSEECKSRNFELRDKLLMVLCGKETQEVVTAEDKLSLKRQLMDTLNRALHKGQVLDVYFTEFLVQ